MFTFTHTRSLLGALAAVRVSLLLYTASLFTLVIAVVKTTPLVSPGVANLMSSLHRHSQAFPCGLRLFSTLCPLPLFFNYHFPLIQ